MALTTIPRIASPVELDEIEELVARLVELAEGFAPVEATLGDELVLEATGDDPPGPSAEEALRALATGLVLREASATLGALGEQFLSGTPRALGRDDGRTWTAIFEGLR